MDFPKFLANYYHKKNYQGNNTQYSICPQIWTQENLPVFEDMTLRPKIVSNRQINHYNNDSRQKINKR